MLLPNAPDTLVDEAKFRDYLLSHEHPVGRAKAKFFEALGFRMKEWQELAVALRDLALRAEAVPPTPSVFGQSWYVAGAPRAFCDRYHSLDRSDRGTDASLDHCVPNAPMTFHELDTVVLTHDLPERGLRAGDLGTVVHVYAPDAVEVEFVTAAGQTEALLTLSSADLRAVQDDDLLAVRRASRVGAA